jgi:aminoglycoside phosphotransferase (APT) family kinase protein
MSKALLGLNEPDDSNQQTPATSPAADTDAASANPDSGLIPRPALRRLLDHELPGYPGGFTVSRLGGGWSCLTFLLQGDGWRLVLRRPPRGTLAPTAHSMAREYRVLTALSRTRCDVPVPRPQLLCEDTTVIGAPFYLMSYVPGTVLRHQLPAALDADECRTLSLKLVSLLAHLHSVNPEVLRTPTSAASARGYLERQIKLMNRRWSQLQGRRNPTISKLAGRLSTSAPAAPAGVRIVHGDFGLHNVLLAVGPSARITAVIDWELSTLGDPVMDLGWLLFGWREPGEEVLRVPLASITATPGFPCRGEIAEHYLTITGMAPQDLAWYAAFAGWKLAIIMEDAWQRYQQGIRDHEGQETLAAAVPQLAQRALDFLDHTLLIG